MTVFTAKLDYALRALLDLTLQPPGRPAQSREIAARQEIPESYLNQVLVLLRRSGLVRSVRGASGGYVLGREPGQVSVADVHRALQGDTWSDNPPAGCSGAGVAWTVRNLQVRLSEAIRSEMSAVSLADLTVEVQRLDESQSLMLGL